MDLTATNFLKQAAHTAEHFGFQKVDILRRSPLCKNCSVKLAHTATATDRRLDNLSGLLTSGLNTYIDSKLYGLEEPVFYYNIEPVPRSGEAAISLQIYGVQKSIAEAILIQAVRSLLSDLGFINHTVRINTLGDRDSIARYSRELNNYMKKRLEDIPPAARELMKDHVTSALMHMVEKGNDLAFRCPSPLEYLSDPSRKHFRDIVEYLDMSETPYEIDPKLLGHHQCYSDALFAIDFLDEAGLKLPQEPLYIRGGRYDNFVERYTGEAIPAVGAVLMLKNKKGPVKPPRTAKTENPSVYVVQLGFGPKIRSLLLIDNLRRAGVQVYQNLASDSLSTQLRDAEDKSVKYTVIMGQKEYVDGTVILRDMIGRNQEHVPVDALVPRLKRLYANV